MALKLVAEAHLDAEIGPLYDWAKTLQLDQSSSVNPQESMILGEIHETFFHWY